MSLHTKAMEAEARAAKGKQMKVITVEKLLEETDAYLRELGAKLVEQGTHDELMKIGGRYTALRAAYDDSDE